MHNLGQTRSAFKQDHLLQTPDTFVRSVLPGMSGALAIIHCGPILGAGFAQYTAEMEDGGTLGPAHGQRFVYILEGEATIEVNGALYPLVQEAYAYVPEGEPHHLTAKGGARLFVIEKLYMPLAGVSSPTFFAGAESSIQPQPLLGDEDIAVRALLPTDVAYDFAVNTMTYRPGASLPMVEVHLMEHGCLILEGGGIYRLSESWYAVESGDFIWMRSFCPQWFGALGKKPAKYLIYKDWNRAAMARRHAD